MFLLIIEVTSSLLLKYNSSLKNSKPYFNREISGYYVFKNSSGYKYFTIKANPNEKDVVIDENGFVSEKKISIKKPDNTLRIFIVGGSAAFGNGQSQPYDKIAKYSSGVYSYESSIAGQISLILKSKYPNQNIEIINACASGRKLNQTIAQYLSLIKDFSPDIIISLDGMNDLSTINGNSPYIEDEKYLLKNYIQLYNLTELLNEKSFLAISELIKVIKFNNNKKLFLNSSQDNADKLLEYDVTKITKDEYFKYEKGFIEGSAEFTRLICYFNAICKVDSVELIYCIQPLLHRYQNKRLTKTEIEMRDKVKPINISLTNTDLSTTEIQEMEFKGDILLRYFFDDYLSATIDSLSVAYDFEFIDLNKSIANNYSETEFYVDYCHLTFEANKIIATDICKKIENIITNSKLGTQ